MPQRDKNILVPLGINWEFMVVSRTAVLTVVGTGGYKRRVSIHTPWRYGSDSRMLAWSTLGSDPLVGEGRLERISSLSRVCASGWEAKRYVPHVRADEVVS
jgi:hypothetical protein